jgi:pre-rRNA-processing protein IPI3
LKTYDTVINVTYRQPIASICISLSSTILLVGTTDGLIHLYDVPSHQLLRSISTHKGMSISHIQTIIKPADLIGHISLEMKAGVDARDLIPVKPVAPFQRIRDLKARDAHEVTLMWPSSKANIYSLESAF